MNTTLRFKLLLVPLFLTFATSLQPAKVTAAAPSSLAQATTPQLAPETTWHEIVSDTGDFSVLMPGKPQELPVAPLPLGKFFTFNQGEPGSPDERLYIYCTSLVMAPILVFQIKCLQTMLRIFLTSSEMCCLL